MGRGRSAVGGAEVAGSSPALAPRLAVTGPDARVRCGTAQSSQRPLWKFCRFTPYPDALAGLPLACVSQIGNRTRGAARRPAPFMSHGMAAWDHCLTQLARFTQRPSPLVHGTDGSFLVAIALHVLLVASTTGVMPHYGCWGWWCATNVPHLP